MKASIMDYRKEHHLCPRCGKPMDREGYYCSDCLAKKREYKKGEREFYVSLRICPYCKKKKLILNETICPECSAKKYQSWLKSRIKYGNEYYARKKSNYAKQKRLKNIEDGICTECGKRPADEGYKTCNICRAIGRERSRMRRAMVR